MPGSGAGTAPWRALRPPPGRLAGGLAGPGPVLGSAAAQVHAGPEAGVVEVAVGGVRGGRGHVRVAVRPPGEFLTEHCAHNGRAPARTGTVVVRVPSVPPGTYAAQAWHDEGDTGRIGRNFLGIPREGVGFSRDPSFRFGPPRFGDAAFEVGHGGGRTALTLRYLLD